MILDTPECVGRQPVRLDVTAHTKLGTEMHAASIADKEREEVSAAHSLCWSHTIRGKAISDWFPIGSIFPKQVGKGKSSNRPHPRRTSMGVVPLAATLATPQLDGIQRSQKLLDVRLQHLQANNEDNNRMKDDVEFIRRLMTEPKGGAVIMEEDMRRAEESQQLRKKPVEEVII
ncbi:hypothetical protein ACOMHN_048650 [Nucella lapillus]